MTYLILGNTSLPEVDMVQVNRIVKQVEKGFLSEREDAGRFAMPELPGEADSGAAGEFDSGVAGEFDSGAAGEEEHGSGSGVVYDYTVLSGDNRVLASFGPSAALSLEEAIRHHDAVMDVPDGEGNYGKVLIAAGYEEALAAERRNMVFLVWGMFGMLAVALTGYGIYLDRKLYRPFAGLQSFARHIAMGNLDVPLPMDRDHVFGAFTESFDIMREELAAARQKEEEANRSKKELVASLSHDIKTPVTSIKLISELLLVTEKGTPAAGKVKTIYDKAEQIDRLITDMLHATLEDLGELKVRPEEKASSILEPMIQNADYDGKVSMDPVPGCLLWFDPLRLEQVIDNIINNAYKYAGTEITVIPELLKDGLRIQFKDYGEGVPEEELPKLIQKFYRGSNSHVSGKSGSGLGLYLSHRLMEQMGGELQYYNWDHGFCVEIFIRLA